MIAFNVFRRGRRIDVVYYDGSMTSNDVLRDLVDHDGYPNDIRVERERKR